MRTQEEIAARISERLSGDILGFEVDEYVLYLDYAHAKPLFADELIEKEWDEATPKLTREDVVSRMKGYMPFAFEKANGRRGISANRSIMHYIAWIWLAGDDGLLQLVEEEYQDRYYDYGRPILEKICEFYGWDAQEFESGEKISVEDLVDEGAEVLIDCQLDIRPRAWERTRGGRRKPESLRKYQEEIFYLLKKAFAERGFVVIDPDDVLVLSLQGFRKGAARIDVDNFIKAFMDAGQPAIWADDKQFIGITDSFVFSGADRDYIRIKIWRLHTRIGEEGE